MVALVGGGISMHEKLCDCETLEKGRCLFERITLAVNATLRRMAGIQEPFDVSDNILCAEPQLLLRTDCRPDFDDALRWVDNVWDEPLLFRECVGISVEKETDTLLFEGSCFYHVGGQHAPHYHLRHCGRWLQLRLTLCSLR